MRPSVFLFGFFFAAFGCYVVATVCTYNAEPYERQPKKIGRITLSIDSKTKHGARRGVRDLEWGNAFVCVHVAHRGALNIVPSSNWSSAQISGCPDLITATRSRPFRDAQLQNGESCLAGWLAGGLAGWLAGWGSTPQNSYGYQWRCGSYLPAWGFLEGSRLHRTWRPGHNVPRGELARAVRKAL